MAMPVEREAEEHGEGGEQDEHATKLQRCTGETGTGPRWNGCWENSTGNGRVSLPHVMLSTPRITLANPKVTMITEMIGSPMSGRRTPRSITRPSRIGDDERQRQSDVERQLHAEDGGPRHVGPEEHQLARPEVHHGGGLEDQHEAQRHQRVDAAHRDAADDQLEHEDDLVASCAAPRAHARDAPARRAPRSCARYLARMVARRTLWVRVSSSSSASSSLSKRANAPDAGARRAGPRLTRATASPIRARHLGLAERSLNVVKATRLASAQLPTFAQVDLDQRDHVGAALADHHRLPHVGAELELVLDERRREARAVGQAQHVRRRSITTRWPSLVHQPGVAGAQPAALEGPRGGLRVLVVAEEHAVARR